MAHANGDTRRSGGDRGSASIELVTGGTQRADAGAIDTTPAALAAAALADAPLFTEWTADDGTRYRYRSHRTFGRQLQRVNPEGKWVFCADPTITASPQTVARRARELRAKQRRKSGNRGKLGQGKVNFEISPEDRLRIKLRDRQRKLCKDGKAPIKLGTLAGVHGLSYATRYIDGGRDAFINMVQLAVLERCPGAEAWYATYADLLPYEREIVSFDDLCAAAGVRPSQLLTEVVSVMMDIGRDVGNLVAAVTHPEVIAALAESGKTIKGEHADIHHKDRMAFLQGRGFLPVPKGAQIHLHASANAQAAAAAVNEPSVPSFAQDIGAIPVRPAIPALPDADPALDLVADVIRDTIPVPVESDAE